jgi:superfamily I DNA/RNA helicase
LAVEPWNEGVEGDAPLQLINSDARTIRVQAGPGTGKTFGLGRRVQRIVHRDGLAVPGSSVLIVAFNRVIARDLRSDIEQCIADSPHDGEPVISTVHALCLQVIGTPLRLLLPHERTCMLYDILEAHPDVLETYSRKDKADQALHEHEAKLTDHLALWQAAQRWLTRHAANLISDLPGLLLDKIKTGDYIGAKYEHVIVDEFQDLTPGEQLLFMGLRQPDGFFVALGDAKQSIYRFRGNDREGLSKLEQLDPGATVTDIPIEECRRCPAPMVDAANKLMALYPPPMAPASSAQANTHVVYWTTPQAEAKGMARCIVDNVRAHPDDRHLAMVTRRRFGYLLRDEIKALDGELTVDLSFSESLLETWPVREAFLFFCLFAAPDAASWRGWLGYKNPGADGNFKAQSRNAPAYLRFLESCGDVITIDHIEKLASENRMKSRGQGGANLWDRANRFLSVRAEIAIDDDDTASDVVSKIFDSELWNASSSDATNLDMGLLGAKALGILEELMGSAPTATRDRHLETLAQRLRYMIATREPFETDEDHDLQVTTLWGAKGVTADHVYILGLCGEALPGDRRIDYAGTEEEYREEQRRLFYVSITRSKNTLVLSRANRIRPGEAQQLGLSVGSTSWHWADLSMSPFLRDIIDVLPAAVSGDEWTGCNRPSTEGEC